MGPATETGASSSNAVDDYIDAVERMAFDPDAPLENWQGNALAKFPQHSTAVFTRDGAPLIISVDKSFIKRASA